MDIRPELEGDAPAPAPASQPVAAPAAEPVAETAAEAAAAPTAEAAAAPAMIAVQGPAPRIGPIRRNDPRTTLFIVKRYMPDGSMQQFEVRPQGIEDEPLAQEGQGQSQGLTVNIDMRVTWDGRIEIASDDPSIPPALAQQL